MSQKQMLVKYWLPAGLSLSGRYLLAGSDDNAVHSWDTLKVAHTGKQEVHF